jgi:hypothetical protein
MAALAAALAHPDIPRHGEEHRMTEALTIDSSRLMHA